MKIVATLLLTFLLMETTQAQDWANLEYYKSKNEALQPLRADENRVVLMGNSITRNWGKYSPEFFERNPNYLNRGIGGQTTPQMLVRFRSDVLELKPQLVVLMAGTNDIAGNTGPMTLDMTFGNIVSMVELAQANSIKVLLCSVLPASDFPWRKGREPADKIAVLNGMLKGYAFAKSIGYVDYYTHMVNRDKGLIDDYTFDGVHPDEVGYRVMEPILQTAIERELSKK